ncbi:hypothetical protein BH18ACI5_BH18ACI5_26720 [soil metagenome]
MSTILFHSSPLVVQLGLHNAPRPLEDNGRRLNGAPGVDNEQAMIPKGPRVMLRLAADRRKRHDDMQQSA